MRKGNRAYFAAFSWRPLVQAAAAGVSLSHSLHGGCVNGIVRSVRLDVCYTWYIEANAINAAQLSRCTLCYVRRDLWIHVWRLAHTHTHEGSATALCANWAARNISPLCACKEAISAPGGVWRAHAQRARGRPTSDTWYVRGLFHSRNGHWVIVCFYTYYEKLPPWKRIVLFCFIQCSPLIPEGLQNTRSQFGFNWSSNSFI